ncbi:hypothetical protein ACFUJY_22410 [Streptomyces sp. NPDC057249]|uniref:hypothetical protein n=1 Tax=Streptomyces sp. NPDC057249 TaxID=3346067 RepID=UPI003629123A
MLLLEFGVRLRAAPPVPLGLLQVGADDVQAEPGRQVPLLPASPAFQEVLGAAALKEAVGQALTIAVVAAAAERAFSELLVGSGSLGSHHTAPAQSVCQLLKGGRHAFG